MKKVIFGAACIVGGLLLTQLLLFIGAYPNAFGSLNFMGQAFVCLGVIISLIGLFLCIFNFRNKDKDSNDE